MTLKNASIINPQPSLPVYPIKSNQIIKKGRSSSFPSTPGKSQAIKGFQPEKFPLSLSLSLSREREREREKKISDTRLSLSRHVTSQDHHPLLDAKQWTQKRRKKKK